MPERILIVDDDPVQRRLLEAMVTRFGYEAVIAEAAKPRSTLLTGPDGGDIDARDPRSRHARSRRARRARPDARAGLAIPVIVQTAQGGIDTVVSAMRAGATDFVVKPVGPERLQVSIRNALNASALEGEVARIKRRRAGTLTFRDISPAAQRMRGVLRWPRRPPAPTSRF